MMPESFRGVANTRGFSAALSRTFTDLAEAGISRSLAVALSGDPELKRRLRRVADLLSVYSRFRERIEEIGGDIHSDFAEATGVVNRKGYGNTIAAYGFYDFNEEQWKLISAIARQSRTILFVPYCDEEPYRFAGRLIDRCSGAGLDISSTEISPALENGSITAELLSMGNDEEEYLSLIHI